MITIVANYLQVLGPDPPSNGDPYNLDGEPYNLDFFI